MLQGDKLKKETMIEALQDTLGNVSRACHKVGISRNTHYRWCREDSEYKERVEDTAEEQVDFVEDKLIELIRGVTCSKFSKEGDIVYSTPPNVTAVIFYLKTKGRHRGYSEAPINQESNKIEVTFSRES